MKEKDFLIDLQMGFCENIDSRIENIVESILSIEKQILPDEKFRTIRYLLGEFHSFKGSAGALQFKIIKTICHKVEDIIIGQQDAGLIGHVDVLLKYCDLINEYAKIFKAQKYVDDDHFLKNYDLLLTDIPSENKTTVNQSQQINKNLNILVIGVSMTLINNLKKIVVGPKLNFSFVNNSADALFRIAIEKFDLIISSYFIEPIDGLTLCMAIKNQWKRQNFKYIIFASQEIDKEILPVDESLLPDKIIIKDQTMYKEFSDYCHSLMKTDIKKILFLDNEISLLEIFKMVTEDKTNCELSFMMPKDDYLKAITNFAPDLIVSDIKMPGVNLLELIEDLQSISTKKNQFVFLTGDTETPLCAQLLQNGALGVFDKSTILDSLLLYLSQSGVNIIDD